MKTSLRAPLQKTGLKNITDFKYSDFTRLPLTPPRHQAGSLITVARWARIKYASALIVCCSPIGWLIGLIFANRIPYRGHRIRVPPSALARTKAELFWGIYESAESRFAQSLIDGTVDVVELGSSLGGVACQIANRLQPGRRMICVEARADLIPCLTETLNRSAANANKSIINAAISYQKATHISLVSGPSTLTAHESFGGATNTPLVPTLTLRELLRKEMVDRFVLVCDIEGSEIDLIRHDASALRHCELAIIEFHETTPSGERISVEAMLKLWLANSGMQLDRRYGPVCVFRRQQRNTTNNSRIL